MTKTDKNTAENRAALRRAFLKEREAGDTAWESDAATWLGLERTAKDRPATLQTGAVVVE